MPTMTRTSESTAPTPCVLLAFELGRRTWKLGFSVGPGQRPRCRQIPAGAVSVLAQEISRAKVRLGLPLEAGVMSCDEAGRDGFWLHRYLVAQGITNHVVDSSSSDVNRRARRAKTDRLDLVGLLNLLARYLHGDRRVWRVVRMPTVAEEDARQWSRTVETHMRVTASRRARQRELTPGTGHALVQLQTLRAIGPRWARGCWRPKSSGGVRFRIVANWRHSWAWYQRPIRVERRITTRASDARGIRTYAASWCTWRGAGCGISQGAR